jgi:hypothetical protein
MVRDYSYWQTAVREAEAELDAARTRSEIAAAARKLERAKAELKRLEGQAAKPRSRQRRQS